VEVAFLALGFLSDPSIVSSVAFYLFLVFFTIVLALPMPRLNQELFIIVFKEL
jgi:hypothetical protein